MKILSIDTSSEACSASINIDGELSTRFQIAPQKHSSLILGMCNELLAESELKLPQLDAVAFSQGPGSFTGLRIAAGVVQGMAYGANLPVIKVSTLDALAQQVITNTPLSLQFQKIAYPYNTRIIAAIDARMSEIYWCVYSIAKNGLVSPLMPEALNRPSDILFENKIMADDEIFAVGSGWAEYKDELYNKPTTSKILQIFDDKLTSAEEVGILAANKFSLGEFVTAGEAIPVYLRNDVAKKSTKQPTN